ncbi:hypothetical protein [Stutzerimonas stutzeri]|uniref:hypothetical protein n=1 Tax=Stutzerimonas stutzeri TaxID=316 RepID=UPI000F7920FD|nr:hypothetical protein [Stutzerimonas stutzeri]RSH63895.1 hypothetical protein EGV02_18885 [Stutzerimonas stutzeri]
MGKFFNELLDSVQQMDGIYRGDHEPSRRFVIDEETVRRNEAACGDELFDTSSTPPKARNEKAL